MRKHARSLVRVLTDHFGADADLLGAEVGVWKGELSADLLKSFPRLDLVMVDLWKPFDGSSMYEKDNSDDAMLEAFEDTKRNTEFAEARRIIACSSSVEEAAEWEDGDFDFAFEDTDHYYEPVRKGLHAWWPKIRVGGIYAGHDYNGMGDRRKGWGVKRAVDEFFGELGIIVNVEPGLVWWVEKPSMDDGGKNA